MEQQIAHDAADTIDALFEGAVGNREFSSSELREFLDVADMLREEAGHSGYDLPEVGDTMYVGRCPVDVVEVTQYTAELYHTEQGEGEAVADYKSNEGYDPNSPVIKVTYPGGHKAYPFPLDRLDWQQD